MGYFHVQVGSPHYGMEVAAGQAPKVKALNLFGYKSGLGTDWSTVYSTAHPTIPIDTVMEYNTQSVRYQVQSSNAADYGMPVLIQGLDSDFNEIFDVVEVNTLSTNYFYRVNKAVILSGSNLGHIIIRAFGGGGNQNLLINPTDGVTHSMHYSVPRNWAFYIFRINATSGTVNSNKYITFKNHVENPFTTPKRIINTAQSTMQNGEATFDRQIPFKVEELTDFSFQAKSSSGDNEFSMFVEGILMQDED